MAADLPKHIHIIGICGVATSALAIAFKERGVKVTGSDKGFYPPVSTELEKHSIAFYPGWHPEKMVENGTPDVIMIGGSGKSSQNPEMIYAKEHDIPMLSYPEIIEQYFLRKNNIVCAGTWAKTSTSAMLSFVMDKAGMDPSYMYGGVSLSQDQAARLSSSDWTILEGDEYTGSQTDNIAKFFHYHPTHLLLTSVSWDHADVYPTEESYVNAFKKLVQEMPENGLIVANNNHSGVKHVLKGTKIKVITYGTSDADYSVSKVKQDRHGISFTITHGGQTFDMRSPMLGSYTAENITGVFAMAHEIGIKPDVIVEAIQDFKGIKRRLEKRLDGDITVLDCHAPTAEKAAAVLQTLSEIYDQMIFVIFEPNTGGRQRNSAHQYNNAFSKASEVIIPRLTKLLVADDTDKPIEGDELAQIIGKTQPNVRYEEDDTKLVEYLKSNAKKGDVIAFLGSHGFRGMIEETVAAFS